MNPAGEKLREFFGSRLKTNFPLASLTTFGIGGPADFFVELLTESELERAVVAAQDSGILVSVLGFGSNVLISDRGIRSLVMALGGEFKKLYVDIEGRLYAGAGARLPKLVTFAAEEGLTGMEPLVGVPGTVGGGIFMNAGTREGEIKDHLISVKAFLMAEKKFQILPRSAIEFGYRRSFFQKSDYIIVSAIFNFPIANDKKEVLNKIKQLMERRKTTQPVDTKNVGSIFRNPPGNFAAQLIEQAGLKGARVGDAVVSSLHANFIVNAGRAKAQDVADLMKKIQDRVVQKFNIYLEPELRMIGEWR